MIVVDASLSGCAWTDATADAESPLICPARAEVPFESIQYFLMFEVLLRKWLMKTSVLLILLGQLPWSLWLSLWFETPRESS